MTDKQLKIFEDNIDNFHLYKDTVNKVIDRLEIDEREKFSFNGIDKNGGKCFILNGVYRYVGNSICEEETYIVFVNDITKYNISKFEDYNINGVYKYFDCLNNLYCFII